MSRSTRRAYGPFAVTAWAYHRLWRPALAREIARRDHLTADPARLADHRRDRAAELLAAAVADVPYYRRVLGERPLPAVGTDGWRDLPRLDKETIRREGEALRSTRVPGTPDSSGGSTGAPTWFWASPAQQLAKDAAVRRLYHAVGVSPYERRAWLWGAPRSEEQGRRNQLLNVLFLPAFRLTPAEMDDAVRRLLRYRPASLYSYPSILRLAAESVERTGAELDLRVVMSSAEMLYEPDRVAIATAFGAPVLNVYGCREFGHVAYECGATGATGMHVTMDRVVVEVPDPDPVTGIGELHVTDLDNESLPFVRFATGDMARLRSGPCACGWEGDLLEELSGRQFDIVRAPSGRAFTGTFFTLALRRPGVAQHQVIQEEPDSLRILLQVAPGADPGAVRAAVEAALDPDLDGMRYHIDLTDEPIPPLPSGKHRFVVGLESR